MAVKFPTETVELLAVTETDKLLVADNDDADASKDITLLVLLSYMLTALRNLNAAVPEPTNENQILVSDASKNWNIVNSFNAGDY